VRAFEGYPEEWYRDGIDLVVAPWRRCAQDATVGLKSGNYLTCLRAREFAHRAGAQEALLRNCAGQVTEGAVTNLFAVVADGTLVTPPVEDGLLPGVTRAVVLNLAREAGIRAAERSIAPEDLGAFREAFVTNSLMEIVPVRRIGDRPVATCPGETTRLLAEAYSQLH
jgi:branched-subunit amino acid aminotransferase/4-amino-4-deoxychorismate lyase